jgi:hypothetical protein
MLNSEVSNISRSILGYRNFCLFLGSWSVRISVYASVTLASMPLLLIIYVLREVDFNLKDPRSRNMIGMD